jgi:hypothetical protein
VANSRCGLLAAWANAYFVGTASLDQAVDAVVGADGLHAVDGLPGSLDQPVRLREVLVTWRRTGGPVRAVLPVPGDVRGLPGPKPFRAAALDAGEAVFGSQLGLVPSVIVHAPSSAPPSVRWEAYPVEPAPPDDQSIPEAQYELSAAIRDSAEALSAAAVGGQRGDAGSLAAPLADARRAGERLHLPPGFPQRAVSLLAQAQRMQAALDLALADPFGGAVDRAGVSARAEALRPLATAVRRARVAAYNALSETATTP